MVSYFIQCREDRLQAIVEKFLRVACHDQIDGFDLDDSLLLTRLVRELRVYVCDTYFRWLDGAPDREPYLPSIFCLFSDEPQWKNNDLESVLRQTYGPDPLIVEGETVSTYEDLFDRFWSAVANCLFEEVREYEEYHDYFWQQEKEVMLACLNELQQR